MAQYSVSGKVINASNSSGLSDLDVFVIDPGTNQPLGSSKTDANGDYDLSPYIDKTSGLKGVLEGQLFYQDFSSGLAKYGTPVDMCIRSLLVDRIPKSKLKEYRIFVLFKHGLVIGFDGYGRIVSSIDMSNEISEAHSITCNPVLVTGDSNEPSFDSTILFISDRGNKCIHKFKFNGTEYEKRGPEFNANGDVFNQPGSLIRDRNKLIVLDESGFIAEGDIRTVATQDWIKYGSTGTGPWQFSSPKSLILLGNYFVVSDTGNNRIQLLLPSDLNNAIELGTSGDPVEILSQPNKLSKKASINGTNFFVVYDEGHNRMVEYSLDLNSNTNLIRTSEVNWESNDYVGHVYGYYLSTIHFLIKDTIKVANFLSPDGQFSGFSPFLFQHRTPKHVNDSIYNPVTGIDSDDNYYILSANSITRQIQVSKFDIAGNLIYEKSWTPTTWQAEGGLSLHRITIDNSGYIYATASSGTQYFILKIALNTGEEVTTMFGSPSSYDWEVDGVDSSTRVGAIFYDNNSSKLYLSEGTSGHLISEINTTTGVRENQFGVAGFNIGQFHGITDFIIDSNGNFLISEATEIDSNNRIQKLDTNGVYTEWRTDTKARIQTDGTYIYITDDRNDPSNLIKIFNEDGSQLSSIFSDEKSGLGIHSVETLAYGGDTISGEFAVKNGRLILHDKNKEEFLIYSQDPANTTVHFSICKNGQLLTSTQNEAPFLLSTDIAATKDFQINVASESYTVSGTIQNADGSAAPNLWVKVYEKGMGDEVLIPASSIQTAFDGSYTATFTSGDLVNITKTNPSVIVKVFDATDTTELTRSRLITRIGDTTTVDLFVGGSTYRPPSEINQVGTEVAKYFSCPGYDDVSGEDVDVLAADSGLSPEIIASYVIAQQLHSRIPTVPVEVFYSMLRGGLPKNVQRFLQAPRETMEHLLRLGYIRGYTAVDYGATDTATNTLVDGYLDDIDEARSGAVLQDSADPTQPSVLGQMLALSGLPQATQEAFYTAFQQYANNGGGDVEAFWDSLVSGGIFASEDDQDKVRLILELGQITGRHLPLMDAVLQLGSVNSTAGLIQLSSTQWKDWITDDPETGLPGNTNPTDDQVNAYVNHILGTVNSLFPTRALKKSIDNGDYDSLLTNAANVKTFLSDLFAPGSTYPDFSFQGTNIAEYIVGNSIDPGGTGEQDNLIADLELIAFAISGGTTADAAKDAKNVAETADSASTATRKGKKAFESEMQARGSSNDTIERSYKNLATQNVAAKALMSEINPGFQSVPSPLAIPKPDLTGGTSQGKVISDLAGDTTYDFCAYENWESALSPGAYLVDLIDFLETIPGATDSDSGKTALLDLRPDLNDLEITQENTETLVPYVDLVNEVLEYKISGNTPSPGYNTSLTAQELKNHPEHQDTGAYDALAGARWPWNMPYRLYNQEAHSYLPLVGLERADILEAFYTLGVPSDSDVLRLPEIAYTFLYNPTAENIEPWYGYTNQGSADYLATQFTSVGFFLDHTGLTLDQFLEYVNSPIVNANGYTISALNSACDLDQAEFNFDDAFLSHLTQYRLYQRAGLTIAQLDFAYQAVNRTTSDFLLMAMIISAVEWTRKTGGSFEEGMAFNSGLLGKIVSLYDSTFLNPSSIGEAELRNLLSLNIDRSELATTGVDFYTNGVLKGSYASALQQALQLAPSDLELILSSGKLPNTIVSMTNLTIIYKIVKVSELLKLTVQEYLLLTTLSQVNVYNADSVTQLLEEKQLWQDIPNAYAAVQYLLEQPATGEPLFDTGQLDLWLTELREQVTTAQQAATSGQELPARQEAVYSFVAEKLGLSLAQANTLLSSCVTDPADDVTFAVSILEKAEVVFPDEGEEDLLPEGVSLIIHRLLKLNSWKTYWNVSTIVMMEVCQYHDRGGWYNIANVPVDTENTASTADWSAFKQLAEYLQIRAAAINPEVDLSPVWEQLLLTSGNQDTFKETLSLAYGWNTNDLEGIRGHLGWGINTSSPAASSWLKILQKCFAVLVKIDAPASTLITWLDRDLTAGAATAIKNSVETTLGSKAHEQLPKVRNTLRDEQVANLAAYWADSLTTDYSSPVTISDVYDLILMDPEMNSCMMTSRLKMAQSVVQLFVQNVALGNYADKNLTLTYDQQQSWKWRKNYRIWEANRKIFLYPENWLNPDFRDDKTTQFESLENALNQQDVTPQTAEKAYREYLRDLRSVASLEITGITQGPNGTVYVFGRTYNLPHRHFFRTWHQQAQWTSWQEINVDIEGEHLIPVVFNRRLVLAWPTFQEVPPATPPSGEGSQGYTDLEVKLAYSVYEEGEWTPKVLSKEGVRLGNNPDNPILQWVTSGFYFRAQETDIGLFVAMFDRNHTAAAKFRLKNLSDRLEVWTNAQPAITSSKILVSETYNYYNRLASTAGGNRVLEIGEREPGENAEENSEIIDRAKNRKILNQVPGGFYLIMPPQVSSSLPDFPFIMQNGTRAWFIVPSDKAFTESVKIEIEVLVSYTIPVKVETNTTVPGICNNTGLSTNGFSPSNLTINRLPQLEDQLGFSAAVDDGSEAVQDEYGNAYSSFTNTGVGTTGNTCTPRVVTQTSYEYETRDYWKERKLDVTSKYKKYQFLSLYHPFVDVILDQLEKFGIDGVLDPNPSGEAAVLTRQLATGHDFDFDTFYRPNSSTFQGETPSEGFEFKYGTPYSSYNWEIFFHAPIHIAKKLMDNQKFEEARRWMHYIFDPTQKGDLNDGPKRYWKTKPFYQYEDNYNVAGILQLLEDGESAFVKQLEVWQQNPFQPFALARLRTVAFMKAVVMTYIENLIAWGDDLFRQDSIESLNEATLLYVMAGRI
ncbi:MAG TPA: hypothetical protein DCE41_14250, partial [Cytophagales bacterium]|nr:hypothetical protein [Cytophagales bacterium]